MLGIITLFSIAALVTAQDVTKIHFEMRGERTYNHTSVSIAEGDTLTVTFFCILTTGFAWKLTNSASPTLRAIPVWVYKCPLPARPSRDGITNHGDSATRQHLQPSSNTLKLCNAVRPVLCMQMCCSGSEELAPLKLIR